MFVYKLSTTNQYIYGACVIIIRIINLPNVDIKCPLCVFIAHKICLVVIVQVLIIAYTH